MKVKSLTINRSWRNNQLEGKLTLQSETNEDVTSDIELTPEIIACVLAVVRDHAVKAYKAQATQADLALGSAIHGPALEQAASFKEIAA